jgi:hypothetical protein
LRLPANGLGGNGKKFLLHARYDLGWSFAMGYYPTAPFVWKLLWEYSLCALQRCTAPLSICDDNADLAFAGARRPNASCAS